MSAICSRRRTKDHTIVLKILSTVVSGTAIFYFANVAFSFFALEYVPLIYVSN